MPDPVRLWRRISAEALQLTAGQRWSSVTGLLLAVVLLIFGFPTQSATQLPARAAPSEMPSSTVSTIATGPPRTSPVTSTTPEAVTGPSPAAGPVPPPVRPPTSTTSTTTSTSTSTTTTTTSPTTTTTSTTTTTVPEDTCPGLEVEGVVCTPIATPVQ